MPSSETSMIDVKTLRELVKLMVANDLTELDLGDAKGEKVTLKRGGSGHAAGGVGAPHVHYVPSPAHAPAMAPAVTSTPAAPPGASGSAEDAGLVPIASPMVGTFYAAASPDAKAFASVGDRVTADSVVCIIEAMKVFNEIKAETSGTIAKVLVANGQAVEFGQPLFMVKPA
jgi:acetyl-CoA carboxylase biotin carboxyl carrier protein